MQIWTEVRTGVGAVNFLTGMGGFLQTLFFGYAGMRLHVEELEFKASQLPPGVTRLALRNVNYLGNVLDLTVRQGEISVYVVSDNRAELPLVLSINNQTAYELTTGEQQTVYIMCLYICVFVFSVCVCARTCAYIRAAIGATSAATLVSDVRSASCVKIQDAPHLYVHV